MGNSSRAIGTLLQELKLQVDDLDKARDRRAGADHVVQIQSRLEVCARPSPHLASHTLILTAPCANTVPQDCTVKPSFPRNDSSTATAPARVNSHLQPRHETAMNSSLPSRGEVTITVPAMVRLRINPPQLLSTACQGGGAQVVRALAAAVGSLHQHRACANPSTGRVDWEQQVQRSRIRELGSGIRPSTDADKTDRQTR